MSERALLVVNMGGPERAADIEPFLLAIFRDPAILPVPRLLRPLLARLIARRRAPKVAQRYDQIGGASPLPDLTRRLVARVTEALEAPASMVVSHAFRYTSPTLEQALVDLHHDGVRRVRLLPLFPHYTDAMAGSVEREARRVAEPLGLTLECLGPFGQRPDVLALWQAGIRQALATVGQGPRVLFVAHGIPMRNVRRGDPYPERVAATARALGAELPAGVTWSLAYQSRMGKAEWTRPYLVDEITRLGREGVNSLTLVPLSFASENLETRYELDIEVAGLAKKSGISSFKRVPAPGCHPDFIGELARQVDDQVQAAGWRVNAD